MNPKDYVPLAVGLIAVLLTAHFSKRNEYAKWLREQRLRAYLSFLRETMSLHRWTQRLYSPPKLPFSQLEMHEQVNNFVMAHSEVQILASESVVRAAKNVDATLFPLLRAIMDGSEEKPTEDLFERAVASFRDAARNELHEELGLDLDQVR
jgi:hypothetical protein